MAWHGMAWQEHRHAWHVRSMAGMAWRGMTWQMSDATRLSRKSGVVFKPGDGHGEWNACTRR